MSLEHAIRSVAGLFIQLSLVLAQWVDPRWLYFTAFVGFNLLQSSITRWCMMETILRKVNTRWR
jgi:hypothetical protein